MDLFARCFLLVFSELYLGGLLALSVPPFHHIERGFYKSTAAVYLGMGVLAFGGRIALLVHAPVVAGSEIMELALWAVSLASGGLYLRSLWGEQVALRARAYALAWLAGVVALCAGAQSFRVGPVLSVEAIMYPLNFLVAALLLGSVTTGMMLGHWYLIDRSLSIEPFRQMFRFFAVMLAIEAAWLVVASGLLRIAGAGPSVAGLQQLFGEYASLLAVRVLLSPLSAAALAWMIWKTLQIPQTMAATGLFYIAILSVLVGEFMSRFILFRTALPL